MCVHLASRKGLRKHNEDNHNIILGLDSTDINVKKVNFMAIYDGHGGKFVSDFLSVNLPQFFTAKNVSYPLKINYVNDVYDKIQEILCMKYTDEAAECGSTCCVICHYRDDAGREFLNVINTGDSRAVLCRNNIAIPLTYDHKPHWPAEENRIRKLGGIVRNESGTFRIGDLSVSRAFGDKNATKYVTHRPDLYKYTRTKGDAFIILACDGLWDVMESQDAVNIVLKNCYDSNMKRIHKNINIAKILTDAAIDDLGSTDNVSCIVFFFER